MTHETDYCQIEKRVGVHGAIGVITLNRPKQLNALSFSMFEAISGALDAWQSDDEIKAVCVQSSSERAFCAGGDVLIIVENGIKEIEASKRYFEFEYQLNLKIAQYSKPYIPFCQGITMGGGCGISIHSRFAVAGDNIRCAMPETAIGLFPDVGATYWLSRLPGRMGQYLALTGSIMNANDICQLELMQYKMSTGQWQTFVQQLLQGKWQQDSASEVEALLQAHSFQAVDSSELIQKKALIDDYFNANDMLSLMQRLNQEQHNNDWCARVLHNLSTKSPTSLVLSYDLLAQAINDDLASCLAREYQAVCYVLRQPDFYEGVRALLIDKDGQPRWKPDKLEAVFLEYS